MKRTNIGGVTGKQLAGAQGDLNVKMSPEDPVISWEGYTKYLNLSRAQHLLFERGENPFAIPTDPREVWEKIYGDFGMRPDFRKLDFTQPKSEFELWPIVVAKGMTPERGYNLCQKLFPCWKYTDRSLDEAVPTNDRNADKASYIIWFKANIEADKEFANLSANQLKSVMYHKSITILERELMEAYHFTLTGKHLDIENWTLCAGSRYSDGYIPRARWYDERFGVDWYGPGPSHSFLRSRSAVSA